MISRAVITKNYQKILKADNGAQFVKVDLHVHTPASGDAQAKNKYGYKFDIRDKKKKLKPAKQLAEEYEKQKELAKEIVRGVAKKGIRLIAITDHNTPSNTHPEDLTHTWYQLIKDAVQEIIKEDKDFKGLCVLPGVEMSTDDLHILVIFDPKEDEKAVYTTHRINFLLRDCKFSLKEYGNYKATGMSSLFDVLEYIETLGSSCIAIPAHIDGGKKAMLTVYKKPGNVFNKLLNHPNLNAVEVVKDTTPAKKKIGGRKGKVVKEYFDGLRDDNRSPVAYIQNSDGHSIEEIGKRFTYVRMGEPSFWSLKNALEDPKTRICREKDYNPDENKTRIIGIAFHRGKEWNYIAFNQNMNCIIGKKRTQKSTIIDLIFYGLNRFSQKGEEKWLIKKRYSVNVFIGKDSDVFCYSRKGEEEPNIFKLENNTFEQLEKEELENLELELPRKYNHEKLEEKFSSKAKLMDFLDWTIFQNEIQKLFDERDAVIEEVSNKLKEGNKTFKDCKESDIEKIWRACDKLFEKRNEIKDASIKKCGEKDKKNLFEVNVTRGTWAHENELEDTFYPAAGKKKRKEKKKKEFKLNKKVQESRPKEIYLGPENLDEYFLDQADMKLLVKPKKYKHLKRLSTGEKNAAMMVLLMNREEFGPLIIDEPEQYIDVSSITGTLVPQMRELKTKQQIICVTRDEHILLSGDAEQVVATQAENKIKVIAGDINKKEIQKQILEIFEGDKHALTEKSRKLSSILE